MRLCSICDKKHSAKGYCEKHYRELPETKDRYAKRWTKYYGKNRKHILEVRKKYNNEHPEIGLKSKIKQLSKLGDIFDMNSKQYLIAINLWSKTIKKLDNFMCKNCSSKRKLNAHHIQPKADFPELSLDLDNGVTLCEDCHGLVHGYDIY